MPPFEKTYSEKKILITGNTGFKGSWLSIWLSNIGAEVYGVSVDVPTTPSHFESAQLSDKCQHVFLDVCNLKELKEHIKLVQPDFLFHLAAQPIVRHSYQEPVQTFATNIMGTVNVLEALRDWGGECSAVIITSDKCYDNMEWTWGYRENDPLGGNDPYSASKSGAEMIVRSYAHSFFADKSSPVRVAVGRAGNVIGGGDWALDRIVPDCIKSWGQGEKVAIRNPCAIRPWQHVLESLSGYLVLGEALSEQEALRGEAFNFGPPANVDINVNRLIEEMSKHWEGVKWEDVDLTTIKPHEANNLKLCCDKALHFLRWQPTLSFAQTVRFTIEWYKKYYANPNVPDMGAFSEKQIQEYILLAKEKKIAWAQET